MCEEEEEEEVYGESCATISTIAPAIASAEYLPIWLSQITAHKLPNRLSSSFFLLPRPGILRTTGALLQEIALLSMKPLALPLWSIGPWAGCGEATFADIAVDEAWVGFRGTMASA